MRTWSVEKLIIDTLGYAAEQGARVLETLWPAPVPPALPTCCESPNLCGGCDLAEREAEEEVDDGPGLRWTDADSTHPAGVVGNTTPLPPPVGADWRGWAVPAVLEVLAEHLAIVGADGYIYCYSDGEGISSHGRFADWAEWREHVAPIIADRIGCDPARAIAALRGSLNRSFMESGQDMGASFAKEFFPQHQRPSK